MTRKHSPHQRHQGQSLIETLFVLFVMAVMCGVAASSMLWVQRKIQIQTAAEDLLNTVLTARTEALRRETRVTVCGANLVRAMRQGNCHCWRLSTYLATRLVDVCGRQQQRRLGFWRGTVATTQIAVNGHFCHWQQHSQPLHFIWRQWPQPHFEWRISGGHAHGV